MVVTLYDYNNVYGVKLNTYKKLLFGDDKNWGLERSHSVFILHCIYIVTDQDLISVDFSRSNRYICVIVCFGNRPNIQLLYMHVHGITNYCKSGTLCCVHILTTFIAISVKLSTRELVNTGIFLHYFFTVTTCGIRKKIGRG